MPKHNEPTKPKKQNRRGNRDLYEVLALFLWLIFLSGTISLAIISKASLLNEYNVTWENMIEIIYVGFEVDR